MRHMNTRREFLQLVGLGAGASLLTPLTRAMDAQPATSAPVVKPNIVYVICDDLGYGDIHCLNPQRGKIPTPNADRLAGRGITFTDCHGGSSVCTPTRYGVLTGRYAWRSRLQAGVLDGGDDPPLIAEGRMTVPLFLRQHGYRTAAIGKWHLGFMSEHAVDTKGDGKNEKGAKKAGKGGLPAGTRIVDGPITRGFEYFFGFSNARTISGLIENDKVIEEIEPVAMLPRLTDRAAKYIAEQSKSDKPFFLYFALNSPHTPIVPSTEWQGKSGLGKYGDYVMESDWALGQVMDAIQKAGIENNTLLIFTSDNGCSPAAKVGQLEKLGHFPSGDMRGYKSDIWDGGHRIPFMAQWPGKIKAASTSSQLTCLADLLATCAELLGEKLPDTAGEDSVSMLASLLGTDKAPVREAIVHHSIRGNFSIRQGPWKLELCPGSGGWGKPGDVEARKQGLPSVQLYDMSQDIGERKNLHADHKDIVQKLTKLLEKYVADGRSTPGVPQKNDAKIDIWKSGGKQLDDDAGGE